jgi:hypothetical protein
MVLKAISPFRDLFKSHELLLELLEGSPKQVASQSRTTPSFHRLLFCIAC